MLTSNEELVDFGVSLEFSFCMHDAEKLDEASSDEIFVGESLFMSAALFTFSLAIFDHESKR